MAQLVARRWRNWSAAGFGVFLLALLVDGNGKSDQPRALPDPNAEFANDIRPLLAKYCLDCHSAKMQKGELDLERFTSIAEMRKDLRPWPLLVEHLDNGEMPPKGKPQPTAAERKRLSAWTRTFIDAEARARAGDPGKVVLRRLNNAEFNYTIRDLTGIDLQPAREFPVDGASGEGFTNTGESLVMSPAFFDKFMNADKEIAAHAVFLPDGFRFSPGKTRNDWTNEILAELRKTYRELAPGPEDGRFDFTPYLLASIDHRNEILAGNVTFDEIAAKRKLNAKYLSILWQALTDKKPSVPLDLIRSQWREAGAENVGAIAAEIKNWQERLWKFNKIGSYVKDVWQEPSNPTLSAVRTLKLKPKIEPGQNEVILYLVSRESGGRFGNSVVWQRPRFEGDAKDPLLLRDIGPLVEPYEAASWAILADTAKYLNACVLLARDDKLSIAALAKKYELDAVILKHWIEILQLAPLPLDAAEPAIPLHLLTKKLAEKPAIKGWGNDAADSLPGLFSNSSDKVEQTPGTVLPHRVVVHPSPKEFAAVVWNSPMEGKIRIEAKIAHAHPACGNGISWWLEHRHGKLAVKLDGGVIDLGKKAEPPVRELTIAKGDSIVLAIGARDGNHSCDLTSIDLNIADSAEKARRWELAGDVADTIAEGNPHADKLGNKEVWQFVRGLDPSNNGKQPPNSALYKIPEGSFLGVWRKAALDPKKSDELGELAERVQLSLLGKLQKEPDGQRSNSSYLHSLDGPLFRGIDLAAQAKKTAANLRSGSVRYGLERRDFGPVADGADVRAWPTSVIEIRLPSAVVRNREFIVEGTIAPDSKNCLAQLELLTAPPDLTKPATAGTPWSASAELCGANPQAGFEAFRRCFPLFLYHSQIVPVDEVVCLRMYFREDEHLIRLFLNDGQKKRLDRLWEELRFVSQYPIAENKYLPLFIGFVTQDQPKELLAYFEGKRDLFRQRSEEFEKELQAAIPKQLEELLQFAARAYRRPLGENEKAELLAIYRSLRQKEMSHGDAFRMVLTRILISPSFMYRLEQPPPGKEAKTVTDWELASRLSYFLWSTMPDAELTKSATEGKLHNPKALAEITQRMLKDDRIRALAVEFGTQWIHVRAFDELNEKNEKLFPTFDIKLRRAINEESVLFFQDLFQNDRSYRQILDADHTFLNELLAKHYGIPGVTGPHWRKVDGVKKHGRGGILGLASVQAKESGASRTSPILRGNWVSETLLGEKLPRPPPNVPQLPEGERGNDGLSMRQLVEKHTRDAACAVCHVRIDPYGFALEKYDPIGRLREKDLNGSAVDTQAKLRDGTEFDGLDGLRNYLLTKKRETFVRSFCKKLLGYSLGRAVMVSDQTLLDEMIAEMDKNEGRLSAAVLAIVRSPQFRMIRGMDAAKEE